MREMRDGMNKAQKAAWFTLIVLATALGLSLAAFCIGYFAIVCLAAWWLVGPEGMVSVNVMPLVLIGAAALFLLVEYLAAFIQYGRGGNNDE